MKKILNNNVKHNCYMFYSNVIRSQSIFAKIAKHFFFFATYQIQYQFQFVHFCNKNFKIYVDFYFNQTSILKRRWKFNIEHNIFQNFSFIYINSRLFRLNY